MLGYRRDAGGSRWSRRGCGPWDYDLRSAPGCPNRMRETGSTMTLRAMLTLARLRSAALPTACWAWTRAVLMMFVYNVVPYISHGDITGDVKLYNRWSQVFGQGRFPQHDPTWQYPPGAGIVIAVPRLIRSFTGMSYYSAFFLLALTSD